MKKLYEGLANIGKAIKESPGWFTICLCVVSLTALIGWLTVTGELEANEFRCFAYTMTAFYIGICLGKANAK